MNVSLNTSFPSLSTAISGAYVVCAVVDVVVVVDDVVDDVDDVMFNASSCACKSVFSEDTCACVARSDNAMTLRLSLCTKLNTSCPWPSLNSCTATVEFEVNVDDRQSVSLVFTMFISARL